MREAQQILAALGNLAGALPKLLFWSLIALLLFKIFATHAWKLFRQRDFSATAGELGWVCAALAALIYVRAL
jgi:hypothetical protein